MSKKQYSVRTAAVAATERRARRSGVTVAASGSGSSYNEIYGDIAGKLDREVFDSMFERVSDGVDADGVERWYIRAKASLVSVGDMTAYGLNGSAGDGTDPGAGVTELRCLDDVILSDPKAGQILKYDGQHWVNAAADTGLDEAALAAYLSINHYAKTSDIPSLVGYATQTWVEGKSYATEAWVNARGYLTQHQDISHLLTREEFEAMFERVDNGDGTWHILAKSHLASVGDITAYGTGGPGSTLGGIGDVTLGSLMAGDVIMWDGQKWVNGQAPGGGLDVEQLAAYLAANNYITQADLGNYVTLDTGQTITGGKRFAATDTNFTQRITVNGSFDTGSMTGYPNIMWHVPNRRYTKVVMSTTGSLHILDGGAGTFEGAHYGIVASQFVRNGGTASQFLKADGSVDENTYLAYVPQNGGLKSQVWPDTWGNSVGSIVAEFTDISGSSAFKFKRDNPSAGKMSMLIDGTVYINEGSEAVASQAWAVCKAGDTMTGLLSIYTSGCTLKIGSQNNGYAHYETTAPNHWFNRDVRVHGNLYAGTNYDQLVWHAGNDGSGSGLDADLLDGYHASDLVRKTYSLASAGESITWQDWLKRNGNDVNLYTRDGWSWALGASIDVGWETINTESYSALVYRQGVLNYAWHMSAVMFIPAHQGVKMLYLARAATAGTAGQIAYGDVLRFADYDTIINSNVASATKLQTARYLWGNSFDGTSGCDGGLTFGLLTGANARNLLYQKMADNDFFRIRCGGTATNAGYVEIATADDGTEPIYVRQYTGEFVNITRTLTLLDGSGNTSMPGHLVVAGDVTAYSDARLKSDIRTLTNRGFITPRTYIKDGKRCIGFLAQEVQQRYPELVMDTGGADHWLSLNYGNLVAVLEAQIIDHEGRIKRLEDRR